MESILIEWLMIRLLCFGPLFYLHVNCQCENGQGTEGKTECISSVFFGDPIYEPAVCLKKSTIKALTHRFVCRHRTSDYCWHQCSITPIKGAQSDEICRCDPKNEATSRDSIVPVKCYMPSGSDCSWYKDCLEKRKSCEDTSYKYAITYAEKYCERYGEEYARFSKKGKKWIDAVRKCLQESLVHLLYPQMNVTCKHIKDIAFVSHKGCYEHPEPNVSFCGLSFRDKARVLWTIKGAFLSEFLKTSSAGLSVMKSCFTDSYPQKTERVLQLEIAPTTTNLTEKNVEDIGHILYSLVGWPRDIVYATSITDSDNSILIKLVIFSQSNNNAYLTDAERVVIEGANNGKLAVLTLTDGKTIRILSIKGCNDPYCSSTWFAVKTSNELRKGLCACVSNVKTAANGRKQANITAEIGGRLRVGSCYEIVDGPTKTERFTWYQLRNRCWSENLWVADSLLTLSALSNCDEMKCSARARELACDIKNNTNITLRDNHPSGKVDYAYAIKNIDDTCNGKAACRSMYTCKECEYPGAPGGEVCLQEDLLHFINELGKEKKIFVSSIAGACHSCNSGHYRGLAVDLSRERDAFGHYIQKKDDFGHYIQKCRDLSGKPLDESSHIHCRFYSRDEIG